MLVTDRCVFNSNGTRTVQFRNDLLRHIYLFNRTLSLPPTSSHLWAMPRSALVRHCSEGLSSISGLLFTAVRFLRPPPPPELSVKLNGLFPLIRVWSAAPNVNQRQGRRVRAELECR